MEIWKDIKGYEGLYQVSNYGNVRSLIHRWGKRETPKILSPSISHNGYESVSLSNKNGIKGFRVNRLVAEAFIPNPKNKRCVNHLNARKRDNRVENLEWCSYKENKIHAKNNGLIAKGESQHLSKLKKEDVLQIRSIYEQGFAKMKEIAEAWGVTISAISAIINRKTWKHL